MIDSENRRGNENRRSYGALVGLILIILILLAAVVISLTKAASKGSYTVKWEKDMSMMSESGENFTGYKSFGNGIIKYSRDGAEYIDKNGNTIWEKSYQMREPFIDVSGNYACIADNGGNSIYIFSTEADTGACASQFPVSKVRISDGGIVYAVMNDTDADYITAFRPDGTPIDLSVKSVISGDGYPYDIAVSPDGVQMISSYAGIDGGELSFSVVFRNFGEVGQNEDAKRVVGGFTDEFEGHIVGRVNFSDDVYSQAFYDGGIVFFSTKVLNTPEILAHETFENEIRTIAYSKNMVVAVTENSDEESIMNVYSAAGKKLGEVSIPKDYQDIGITGNNIYVFDHDKITLYTSKCRKSAEAELTDMTVNSVYGTGSNNELTVISGNSVKRIRL